jgi:hypothetical protein
MTKSILLEKYPVLSHNIKKEDTSYTDVAEFINYFKDKIEKDPIAAFIGIFNHFEHTKNLESGEIAKDIHDAQNIVFCFGQKIPNPLILSVRPRSIAIVEDETSFTISFMEAPMAPMSAKMESWVEELSK